MYPNIVVRRLYDKLFIIVAGDLYVPESSTVLSAHDIVSVFLRGNGYATVYIKHKPNETWVLHKE